MKFLKSITFAALVLAVVVPVAAQKKSADPTLKCAVMPSMTFKLSSAIKAKHFSDYKGKRYYFCCGACPPMFKKDPAKYAAKAKGYPIPKASKS